MKSTYKGVVKAEGDKKYFEVRTPINKFPIMFETSTDLPDGSEALAEIDPHDFSFWDAMAGASKVLKTDKPKYVVYVFDMDDGSVKIGVTSNLCRRIKEIEHSGGREIVDKFATDAMSKDRAFLLEKETHNFFKKSRGIGEYFAVSFERACTYLRSNLLLK